MIELMEGVDTHAPPQIPTILINGEDGRTLKKKFEAGDQNVVHIRKAGAREVGDKKVESTVFLRCSPMWQQLREPCVVGDSVDAHWDGDRQHYRATVKDVLPNRSLVVSWLDTPEQEAVVPAEQVYKSRDTISCTASHGGLVIEEVQDPTECQSVVWLHAPYLCADKRFLPKPEKQQPIVCTPEGAALAGTPSSTDNGKTRSQTTDTTRTEL